MTKKAARKIGLWTAIAMLFGSIVGIGIFFKNGSVTRAAEGSGTTTLLAWIIGGLISLFAAIAFSEIGSQKLKSVHGIAAWSEVSLGKKTGYFSRFNLGFFYYGILMVIFGVFVSEVLFQTWTTLHAQPSIYVHIIVGTCFDIFFLTLNFISIYAAGWVSRFATLLKLIPLILVAIAGLALANTNNAIDPSNGTGINAFTNGKPFSFTGLLAALPAVLFAYDAFLDVGTYASKVEGGSKTVSKSIIVTLLAVLALYSLISVAHILHGAGTVTTLFAQVFPTSAQKGLGIFVWVFLFISACGVHNGVSVAAVAAFEQNVRTFTYAGSKTLVSKIGLQKATIIYASGIWLFWALLIDIPAIALGSDAFIDAISNFPTLFFFAIYGLTILGYWRKRNRVETEKINNKLFKIAAALAIIGIFFVVAYQLIYGFTIQAFIHPSAASHAGFIIDGPFNLLQFFGLFVACFTIFFLAPPLNWLIAKKYEHHAVIINTQAIAVEGTAASLSN